MGKPEYGSEQDAQNIEIVQRFEGQDFLFTQRLELRHKESPRNIARVAMSQRNPDSNSTDSYVPSDDFDMPHYIGGDSDRVYRTTSVPRDPVGMTDNFSHDFDAPWYQGRI